MRVVLLAVAALGLVIAPIAMAQSKNTPESASQIDYQGFRNTTAEVESYREDRLVTFEQFQRMAREPNTIVLDARSADAYARGHIGGAINLPFTDFTDASLREALGNPNTRILIYCNNNFSNNAAPVVLKRIELALNIQTFINLYGYGYRNVYELGDVIDFTDPQVGWVRTAG